MAELVSVVGGLYASVNLDPSEVAAAQAAITAASKSFAFGAVYSDLSETPNTKAFNVYDITPSTGKTYVQGKGEQAVILQGTNSATLTGYANAKNNILVGNSGADTINTTGGTGTIVLGTGKNQVSVAGGSETIQATGGLANQTHLLLSGADTITYNFNSTGTNVVDATVSGGSDRISSNGQTRISTTSASSTLVLLSGNDTVTATGSAAVRGGTGTLDFIGGTTSGVRAGSGRTSMFGGTGTSSFYGSTVTGTLDSLVGGSGKNYLYGGAGRDTLVSGASKGSTSTVFEFMSTVSGGVHTITGYTQGKDVIDLQGYKSTDVKSDVTTGGNTVIRMDDGTTITVKGATVTLAQLKFT